MKTYKYIYKITNMITNKFYIGKTTSNIKKRFERHCSKGGSGSEFLSGDIEKYGKENFKIEVIDIAVSLTELQNKERYWILITNATIIGYNKVIPQHKYDTRSYIFGLTKVYKFKPYEKRNLLTNEE